MQVFEDPYKAAGSVEFRIHNVSQFVRCGPAFRSLRASDSVYVRGFQWKILAIAQQKQNGPQIGQKCFSYGLMCNIGDGNTEPDWSCSCLATLTLVAQKEDKTDHSGIIEHVFKANERVAKKVGEMPLEDLMNPENGWYDTASDSIVIHAHIRAADSGYIEYTMRSEHAIFVDLKDGIGPGTNTSNLAIEEKLWSFIYASESQTLQLHMAMHQSDFRETIAECVFWYWSDKDIRILKKIFHIFGEEANVYNADSRMKTSKLCVPTAGVVPANKKFGLVLRLLDEIDVIEDFSMDSYYGDYEGVDMVTLCIDGNNDASFVVPKYALICASPVFERMFANEMAERAMGRVENIKEAIPSEFCYFLRAICPKQELPNPSNVFALTKLAHHYQCKSLLERCEKHLINCIEITLIHRLTCANVYGLKKLKNSLMVSFEGTGLFKLFQQAEPYLGTLNELAKKIE